MEGGGVMLPDIEEFREGCRRARRDHFSKGRKYVKVKADTGLQAHTWPYVMGYRAYARAYCPVRRNIDF